MLFYLLMPVILLALFFAILFWFFVYPSSIHTQGMREYLNYDFFPFYCAFAGSIFVAPLYFLSALWRWVYGKPLNKLNRLNFTIVILVIFLSFYVFSMFLFGEGSLLTIFLSKIYKYVSLLSYISVILYLLLILFVAMFKACYVILRFDTSKEPLFEKVDCIRCVVLCAMYFIVCHFFIREGGIIYLLPFSEKYSLSANFPDDKRTVLKSFLKLAAHHGYDLEYFFHPDKEISYEDLLAMVAVSPVIVSDISRYRNPTFFHHPKLYVRYWTNKILYPLSNDLAQKDYWGRKLIVSSENINRHFYYGDLTMERDIFLAFKYMTILRAMSINQPKYAYQRLLDDKQPTFNTSMIEILLPQMTSEEEKEWLYWYKMLWPQIELELESDKSVN